MVKQARKFGIPGRAHKWRLRNRAKITIYIRYQKIRNMRFNSRTLLRCANPNTYKYLDQVWIILLRQ